MISCTEKKLSQFFNGIHQFHIILFKSAQPNRKHISPFSSRSDHAVPGWKTCSLTSTWKQKGKYSKLSVGLPSYLWHILSLSLEVKENKGGVLWRTVSLLPALSKTMLLALVIILVFAKKLRICLRDSPDTSGRKPYPERERCGLKNIWIRVDGILCASKNIKY